MTGPVSELILGEPVARIDEIVSGLRSGTLGLDDRRTRLARRLRVGARTLGRLERVLGWWHSIEAGSPTGLAATLEAANEVRVQTQERSSDCELVWTGATPPGSGLRSTLPVVREMLDAADRTVLVVAYNLWFGQGRVMGVLERLGAAARRGVDITFIVDRNYQYGHNLAQLRSRWPDGIRRPTVLTWGAEHDSIAKLHAKVLVVDAEEVLITSANLTGHGMDGNLELGVRVRGEQAAQAERHFRELARLGTFHEEEW